jgi:NhaC family Na+:H+ antiporter
MTTEFMKKLYPAGQSGRSALAADTGNTSLIIAPLVPWNIAGTFPAGVLAVGPGFIPYAFYLYLVPLFILGRDTVTRHMRPVTGLPGDEPAAN